MHDCRTGKLSPIDLAPYRVRNANNTIGFRQAVNTSSILTCGVVLIFITYIRCVLPAAMNETRASCSGLLKAACVNRVFLRRFKVELRDIGYGARAMTDIRKALSCCGRRSERPVRQDLQLQGPMAKALSRQLCGGGEHVVARLVASRDASMPIIIGCPYHDVDNCAAKNFRR